MTQIHTYKPHPGDSGSFVVCGWICRLLYGEHTGSWFMTSMLDIAASITMKTTIKDASDRRYGVQVNTTSILSRTHLRLEFSAFSADLHRPLIKACFASASFQLTLAKVIRRKQISRWSLRFHGSLLCWRLYQTWNRWLLHQPEKVGC